jgi:hypothetical protein
LVGLPPPAVGTYVALEYESRIAASLTLGVEATTPKEMVHTVPDVVGDGTATVTVTEVAPGMAVGAVRLQVPVPLVFVVPIGSSSETPPGNVSVKVTVCVAPVVFVSAYPTASVVLRLIGLAWKLVLMVTEPAASAEDALRAATVVSVARTETAAPATRFPDVRRVRRCLCAISLKVRSP